MIEAPIIFSNFSTCLRNFSAATPSTLAIALLESSASCPMILSQSLINWMRALSVGWLGKLFRRSRSGIDVGLASGADVPIRVVLPPAEIA